MSDEHSFSLFDPVEDNSVSVKAAPVQEFAKVPVDPKIEESWKKVLSVEFQQPYFQELKGFLLAEKKAGKITFPPAAQIFHAFELCPFNDVKVVILGQDPYHGAGQAHGLCFSVNKDVRVPPSLQNMYKELHDDLKLPIPSHGNLEHWAEQGVLLLNTTLTVEAKSPTSHAGKGWETFTDQVIRKISEERNGVVFLLWGNFAKSKKDLIDTTKHTVLTAPHPSPFSAHSGFFGCKHFSKTNEILKKNGQDPIDWGIE
jgi:uracil-DNA glycosylase